MQINDCQWVEEERNGEVLISGDRVSFGSDENILELHNSDGFPTL